MISGHPPIKARKLRYYEDENFTRRVLPPPALSAGRYADVPPARPDDWSDLAIPAVPATPAMSSTDDLGGADDGGPRRQPELSEVTEYSPEPLSAGNDLGLLDDDDDLPLPYAAALPVSSTRNAAHGSAGFPRPQRRNRLMSQYRLNLFIQHEHAKRLDELAAKKACRSPASLPLPWRPGCRPTRATSAKPRLPSGWIACRGRPSAWSATRTSDRNAGAVHPLLPDRQHAGARSPSGRGPRQGKARFEQFVEQLGRHLLRGRSLVRDVVEELYPEPVRMDDAAALAEAQERAS